MGKKRLMAVPSKGVTMIEMVIALAIFFSVIGIGFLAFQSFHGKTSENLSKRLILQMEARRALLTLFRELQEGIEIVSPPSGTTLPYLVFKDFVNNLRMVYLEEDPVLTKEEGKTIYRAMMVMKDPSGEVSEPPKLLMNHVLKLNFTTYNPGAVLISTQLRGGNGEFSLVNYVRLQNVNADEELP